MPDINESNDAQTHRKYSVQCFNSAWDLIDKEQRTPDENMMMMLRSAASLWHWTQREDCTARHLSIGYWQLSRVFALMNKGAMALEAGEACLRHSPKDDHFCRGYAYEAMARAASVLGDREALANYLERANECLALIRDEEERKALSADIRALEED